MQSIADILSELNRQGIAIRHENGQLAITPGKEQPGVELLKAIKQHKQEIISYLANYSGQPTFSALKKADRAPWYPLSSAQYRIWLTTQVEHNSAAYNIPGLVEIKGNLKTELFIDAFHASVKRHDVLRTFFSENAHGEPVQVVMEYDECNFHVQQYDWRNIDNKTERLHTHVQELALLHMPLGKCPLLKFSLIQMQDQQFMLAFVVHHILCDGWSVNLLTNEIWANYHALDSGKTIDETNTHLQYADYAVWQQQGLKTNDWNSQKNFWLRQLAPPFPVLQIASEITRPPVKTYNGASCKFIVPGSVYQFFRQFCVQQQGTAFSGILCLVHILLFRYSQQRDIIIGTPVAGRVHADLNSIIGLFVNTLPIRNKAEEGISFLSFFHQVKNNILSCFHNQEYPLDVIAEELGIQRETSRSLLFDTLVVLQNFQQMNSSTGTSGNLQVKSIPLEQAATKFDLTFLFHEEEHNLLLVLEYNTDVYSNALVKRLGESFALLMQDALNDYSRPIEQLSVLPAAEYNLLVKQYNQTAEKYPEEENIVSLFRRCASLFPEHTALVCGNARYSYCELENTSNQFAAYLVENCGVVPGDYVCIVLERSEWMIIAILAILKANAAFVPVDVSHPEERIAHMVQDSGAKLLLGSEQVQHFLAIKHSLPADPLPVKITQQDCAYLIYTSGSTGLPKGTRTLHKGIVNYNNWFTNRFGITDSDSSVLLSSYVFSGVYTSIFCTLLNGGALHVIPKLLLDNSEELAAYIHENRISFVKITPLNLHLLIHYGGLLKKENAFLRLMVIGGDTIKTNDVEELVRYNPVMRIVYHFGSTETTMAATTHEITLKNLNEFRVRPRIGRPIDNVQVYILDNRQQLLPHGVIGEMYISGHGVAGGYLNQPGLTLKTFLENPFQPGTVMFRSGDIGRWLSDGTIEFLGRKDFQVKVRGYRIEIAEIEREILACNGVKEVVVTAITDTEGNAELAAYIVAHDAIDLRTIRQVLKTKLPVYMIPAFIIPLKAFPLGITGKLDKSALPDPFSTHTVPLAVNESASVMEQQVRAIWEEILNKPDIGLNDGFFDIGGHSLKLARLVNRYYSEFKAKIPMADLFREPTIAQHARLISSVAKQQYYSILPAAYMTDYPLSNAQKRLWVLSQFQDANIAFNVPVTVLLDHASDHDLLEKAVNELVKRHEILRTCFRQNLQGEPRQQIIDSEHGHIGLKVFSNISVDEADRCIHEAQTTPFILESFPLIRAGLYILTDGRAVFSIVLHHLISDGWSMSILIRELVACYNALKNNRTPSLAPLNIQYKDYACWQSNSIQHGELEESRRYWLQKLADLPEQTELSFSKKRPSVRTYVGAELHTAIPVEHYNRLVHIVNTGETTLFMGLLSLVNIVLYRYSFKTDLVVGAPFAGRDHPNLEAQIGFYVNMLPLRMQLTEADSFMSIMKKAQGTVASAIQHQMFPLDELLDQLQYKKAKNRGALFDIVVSLQSDHIGEQQEQFENIKVSPYTGSRITSSRFDLLFNFSLYNNQLGLFLNYNTDIYSAADINEMMNYLGLLFEKIEEYRNIPITDLVYLGGSEAGSSGGRVMPDDFDFELFND